MKIKNNTVENLPGRYIHKCTLWYHLYITSTVLSHILLLNTYLFMFFLLLDLSFVRAYHINMHFVVE